MNNLLTIQEAASCLRISVSTLYRWIHYKKIEHVKIGNKVMFTEEALDKFIKNNTITPE